MNDWLTILKVSGLFLLLFVAAEVLHRFLKTPAEITRKIVHIGTGLLTILIFPFAFRYLWQVIAICSVFLILLLLSIRLRFLPSVNKVQRTTLGSVLFPVVVIIIFTFYRQMQQRENRFDALLYFSLPLLIMTIADPVAAFTGNYYKKKKGSFRGKTAIGSIAFFGVSFILTAGLMNEQPGIAKWQLLLYALLIAFATTIAERFSGKGWDNFTIPITAAGLLYLIA